MTAILPGSTIGILGGGQLGRMTAIAARTMGYSVQVLDPDAACAAGALADRVIAAPLDDVEAVSELARGCDVVTLEIEKVDTRAMAAAALHAPVRPSANVLHVVQDRVRQRAWLEQHGFPVGPWRPAATAAELVSARNALGGAVFAKACTGGYDGRAQLRLPAPADTAPSAEREGEDAWRTLGERPCVVEAALELAAEISVMVARRPGGQMMAFPPALNHHEQGILDWSVLPAPLEQAVIERATTLGCAVAAALDVVGVVAVELFVLADGTMLVNELAPRPHNSFHHTERATLTSQFEQLVRAICDLPLGATDVVQPVAIANILGDAWLGSHPPRFADALAVRSVRVHLYGKRGARPGRKMGHLSAAGGTPEEAVTLVREAARRLAP